MFSSMNVRIVFGLKININLFSLELRSDQMSVDFDS